MDIQSLMAAQRYTASKPALQPDPASAQDVQGRFAQAARDFTDTVRRGEDVAQASMIGDADPHALVEALAQSELAVETVVAVRNKVVEAYQEILRMPV
ncbi:flagellar hook-basal body complex protein FliE [Thetidibacter halocola]|uniref:Flagellar hook-basal body complex protein FliE n=1 Tax=Thetidibacter halocola TaxID=2827239 RepID=A0A8J8B7K9_9RHOB|nr:flagellar hook-basal body complex protein FliE [Thetidibacter halocola]MBS0123660.1 flagellar hook-basal body complex protein FliE [Thetidibacter halocola]